MSEYKIVRSVNAGVFCGKIESRDGQRVVLTDARRLWYWSGAASLSQLAQSGTSNPAGCQFPEPVDRVEVFEVIEILDVTDTALQSIKSVKVWSA